MAEEINKIYREEMKKLGRNKMKLLNVYTEQQIDSVKYRLKMAGVEYKSTPIQGSDGNTYYKVWVR